MFTPARMQTLTLTLAEVSCDALALELSQLIVCLHLISCLFTLPLQNFGIGLSLDITTAAEGRSCTQQWTWRLFYQNRASQ